MHLRAIGRRGIGLGGRVAAVACIIYLGLGRPGTATNQTAPRYVSAIDSTERSSQLSGNDTQGPGRKVKHFPAARRISRRSIMRRIDLNDDGGSRRNQTTPTIVIVDLDWQIRRSGTMIATLVRPMPSFYCLLEQIRERARPISENQI
jgi:hypothetical protein